MGDDRAPRSWEERAGGVRGGRGEAPPLPGLMEGDGPASIHKR